MMVIFVSQCEKKALKRTRRVLDAFADRIGDNTWQTVMTEEGLQAVKKLLRQTASKNTAVSCHWIRSRARSDLLWVVGKREKFDYRGVVAVNRTKRNILHSEWENNWRYAGSIQIIATLAALLHDMGKTTVGFQDKLKTASLQSDPYRHEWISLKLFEAMIAGCETDEQWLSRFANFNTWLAKNPLDNILKQTNKDNTTLEKMPPLAQWVAWLIISHHRLPPFKKVHFLPKEKEKLRNKTIQIKQPLEKYYGKITAFEDWVKAKKEKFEAIPSKKRNDFWQIDTLVMQSPVWQKAIKRWVKKALNDPTLMGLSQQAVNGQHAISDTFLLYLSRLCLMVGDHNYSSLGDDTKDKQHRKQGDKAFHHLAANTDRQTRQTKQALDEHLIGVGALTAAFARKLPVIADALPALTEQQSLAQNTSIPRFKWQNKAYLLAQSLQKESEENGFFGAQSLQKESEENGFFGVNMASTGCGKTIANARIMYGLANPKKGAGARFTIALGLRILTLQTGQSFRQDLGLSAEKMAILVGGQANKKLFDINQDRKKQDENQNDNLGKNSDYQSGLFGSESSEEMIDEWLDSQIDYHDYEQLNLGTVIENPKARDLLFSPIVTCTVDHLIQASECKRGGKYIAPMLRLLSSDLILDEPDDFDHNDLPALSRLVHLAGLLGSRVLLSSATLTPDLLAGLFQAYQAGREHLNRSQNKGKPNIVCAWFDEQDKAMTATQCLDSDAFTAQNQQFTQKRERFLAKQAVRRKADILPLQLSQYDKEKASAFYAQLGQTIIDGAIRLHNNYHQTDKKTGKSASVGLVRIANINNIIPIITQLFEQVKISDDIYLHISCYHSRQLLVLRNALETKLDRILRRDKDDNLFQQPEIQTALQKSLAKQHIFIVFATPVAEVGRDHDYDWAIVEPSSMRSIIQLAGRIWRHRPEKVADKNNLSILQYNIRHLKGSSGPVFTHPGFETKQFKPASYDLHDLLTPQQLAHIDARPRIIQPSHEDIQTLSDLEHRVMRDLLNNDKLNYVNAYWDAHATANRVHTHLQQISPFRAGKREEDFLLIPNQDDGSYDVYYAQDVYKNTLAHANKQNAMILPLAADFSHPQMSPWLVTDVIEALHHLQAQSPDLADKSLRALAARFAIVSLDDEKKWRFSSFLGFGG